MAVRQSIPRLRRIRFKNGGEVSLLRPGVDASRAEVEKSIRRVLDAHTKDGGDIAGYALVVWAADFSSTADAWNGPDSRMPGVMVPDFARNRLLAEKIQSWAIQAINRQRGV